MSKISEKCVAEQLTEHLNSSPFTLHPMQFGFRASHSTETAFLWKTSNQKWAKEVQLEQFFLDLKKVLNTHSQNVLF